ncbi:hypothetical protein PIB30_107872, partial [Stylosanthes scabra]|nr:hypothetical protein [Stylosanthes scabra]
REDSTRSGGSETPRVTRLSSLTDFTTSSATTQPKESRDHLYEDVRSEGLSSRFSFMRAAAYHPLSARGARATFVNPAT